MIEILIPNSFVEERSYIISVLVKEYLGLDYKLTINEKSEYEIRLNSRVLIIEDHFWKDKTEYLAAQYIPSRINWSVSTTIHNETFPVIFGYDHVIENKELVRSSIDIFSSSFFMLSRWEEYVIKTRDKHDRFPATASLAYKNRFLDKPIVNIYTELLWQQLLKLDHTLTRKKRTLTLLNTHDIDTPYMWQSIRNIFGRLRFHLKNKSISTWFKHDIPNYLACLLKLTPDPFDTYDLLMNSSEKAGTKSYFFAMDYGTTNYDKYYKVTDKRMQKLFKKIQERGHYIGFHPSYNLYNSIKSFKEEVLRLQTHIQGFNKFGRHHFLRFQIPQTWKVWEEAGMIWDTTLGYADMNGFRCGTCYEFPVFDILDRKPLNLREKPLLFMEQSAIQYAELSPDETLKSAQKILKEVAKYNGEFVMLWHNPNLNMPEFKKFKHVYMAIIDNFIELKQQANDRKS